jgi:hypothetical protein
MADRDIHGSAGDGESGRDISWLDFPLESTLSEPTLSLKLRIGF